MKMQVELPLEYSSGTLILLATKTRCLKKHCLDFVTCKVNIFIIIWLIKSIKVNKMHFWGFLIHLSFHGLQVIN